MDIPTDLKSQCLLFRQKGNCVCAVPLLADKWPEQQPMLLFWKPDHTFYQAWVPDPHFRLLPGQPGGWTEVEYNLERLIDFVFPAANSQPFFGQHPLQIEMESDLRRRHERVVNWILEEAWPDLKAAWHSLKASGSSGASKSSGRPRSGRVAKKQNRSTGGTGSTNA